MVASEIHYDNYIKWLQHNSSL